MSTEQRNELAAELWKHHSEVYSIKYDGTERAYCVCGAQTYPDKSLVQHQAETALRWIESRKPAPITDQDELEDAIRRSFEEGEHLVLMSGTRPWIIWEDDYGLAHVSSAPHEDDPESFTLDDIPLPATVLHVGGQL